MIAPFRPAPCFLFPPELAPEGLDPRAALDGTGAAPGLRALPRPCLVNPDLAPASPMFAPRAVPVASAPEGLSLPRDPALDGVVARERARASVGPAAERPSPSARPLLGPHKVMAGDRALVSAPAHDPVRVQPFRTDSRIVAEGQKYLGTPYVWGGDDVRREGGLDCSGFTHAAMRDAGARVPLSWFRRPVDPRVDPRGAEAPNMHVVRDPRPGDVVVFGKDHIGIYTGNVDGVAMYMSANHGGRSATRGHSGGARVDVMPVRSHPTQPPVYFRYTP